jgi:hypothetical protein
MVFSLLARPHSCIEVNGIVHLMSLGFLHRFKEYNAVSRDLILCKFCLSMYYSSFFPCKETDLLALMDHSPNR